MCAEMYNTTATPGDLSTSQVDMYVFDDPSDVVTNVCRPGIVSITHSKADQAHISPL
jgi:hypothetical protein